MKEAEEDAAAAAEDKGRENVNDTFDYEAFFRDYFDLSYTPFTSPEITEYPSFENTLVNPTSLSGHLGMAAWTFGST